MSCFIALFTLLSWLEYSGCQGYTKTYSRTEYTLIPFCFYKGRLIPASARSCPAIIWRSWVMVIVEYFFALAATCFCLTFQMFFFVGPATIVFLRRFFCCRCCRRRPDTAAQKRDQLWPGCLQRGRDEQNVRAQERGGVRVRVCRAGMLAYVCAFRLAYTQNEKRGCCSERCSS